MIESSDYLKRAEKMPYIKTSEKIRIKFTDDAIRFREIGRLLTGACFAILAVASFFHFDLSIPSTLTLIAITYWSALSCVTHMIEPQTISIVEKYEKKNMASTSYYLPY